MLINQNEKYLLKFISSQNNLKNSNQELLEIIYKLGIKLTFKDPNPVYQIIDELTYCN